MQKLSEDNIAVVTGATIIMCISLNKAYKAMNVDDLVYGLIYCLAWWAICKFLKYVKY